MLYLGERKDNMAAPLLINQVAGHSGISVTVPARRSVV